MNSFDRLELIEREFDAALLALSRLRADARRDATVLRSASVTDASLRHCINHLEWTYVVRLFSEFEFALRRYWAFRRRLHSPSETPVARLIDQVVGDRNISASVRADVHAVRRVRNTLVHLPRTETSIGLRECRARTSRFLAQLPHDWLYVRDASRSRRA